MNKQAGNGSDFASVPRLCFVVERLCICTGPLCQMMKSLRRLPACCSVGMLSMVEYMKSCVDCFAV